MKSVKEIVLISALIAILFVQEQVLTFIPNVQFTFLLLIVYGKLFSLRRNLLIIFVHVLFDNLFMGSLNITALAMLVGYSLIPITLKFIKSNNEVKLAFLSILFVLFYTSSFIFPNVYLYNIKVRDYLIADIPFTAILLISTFLSVLWLYKPINRFLKSLIKKSE